MSHRRGLGRVLEPRIDRVEDDIDGTCARESMLVVPCNGFGLWSTFPLQRIVPAAVRRDRLRVSAGAIRSKIRLGAASYGGLAMLRYNRRLGDDDQGAGVLTVPG